jgi:hypothetical protein
MYYFQFLVLVKRDVSSLAIQLGNCDFSGIDVAHTTDAGDYASHLTRLFIGEYDRKRVHRPRISRTKIQMSHRPAVKKVMKISPMNFQKP